MEALSVGTPGDSAEHGASGLWRAVTELLGDHDHYLARITGHDLWLRTMAIGPDGTTLASGGDDRNVTLWHLGSGVRTATLTGGSGAINEVAFSPLGDCSPPAARMTRSCSGTWRNAGPSRRSPAMAARKRRR